MQYLGTMPPHLSTWSSTILLTPTSPTLPTYGDFKHHADISQCAEGHWGVTLGKGGAKSVPQANDVID